MRKKSKNKFLTAELPPSGKYRCQAMVKGQRISVVDDDARTAQAKAVALQGGLIKHEKKPVNLIVSEAIARYIESKNVVLFPSTIDGYDKIKKNLMWPIGNVKLEDLAQEKIQRWINDLAKSKTPKTVANTYGLLSAVLAECKPDMRLRTALPRKRIRHEVQIPSERDLKAIIGAAPDKI